MDGQQQVDFTSKPDVSGMKHPSLHGCIHGVFATETTRCYKQIYFYGMVLIV